MCGIAGILAKEGSADPELVRRMTNSMFHRGPIEDGYLSAGPVGLGMRRLSIIDVKGGHQPVFNEDRSIAAVFNGEIYNYRELTDELEAKGHQFTTRSDSEVVVHMYEEMGVECVTRFNGMFALALWDSARQRLFVVRDRLGVKPLYYYDGSGHFAFASELKALLQCSFVEREIDPHAVADYLSLMYVRAPRTPLKHVHKLLPGHFLVVEKAQTSMRRYWDLRDHAREVTDATLPRVAEEVLELLRDSVRLRLRSDVPVGAFLSGGIDSSAIVALAGQQLEQPLNTYSVGFGEGSFNELGYARSVAQRYGTNHHETIVSVEDAINHLPKLVWHLDEPNADSAMIPTYLLSQFAATNLRVILTGLGGDELFGGYHRYFDGPRVEHAFRRLPFALRKTIARTASAFGENQLTELLRRNSDSVAARYMSRISVFPQPDLRRLLGPAITDGVHHLTREFDAYPGTDPVNQLMFVDALTYLPDDILHITDRMSMAVSLEARTPFLDYRLVQYSFSLPGSLKVDQLSRTWKVVLKEAVSGLLPEQILQRPKWGFGGPVNHWMRNGLHEHVRAMFRDSHAVRLGLLDPAVVKQHIDLGETSNGDAQRLWTLLILELWSRIFAGSGLVQQPTETLRELAR